MTMSILYFLWFILTGLPIIGYPVILMANLMSFAGHRTKNTPRLSIVIMKSFLWLTTLYPITYFFALYKYKNTPSETHYIWAGIILLHLFLIVLTFRGWNNASSPPPRDSKPLDN